MSSNKGESWTPRNNGIEYPGVESLAIEGNYIYAGKHKAVYVSTNDGEIWERKELGYEKPTSIDCLAASGNCVFAGTMDYGVFKSTDNGETWEKVESVYAEINDIAIEDSLVVAGTNDGIFVSNDKGGFFYRYLYGEDLWEVTIKDDCIFAGSPNGIFISEDKGENWSHPNMNINELYVMDIDVQGDKIYAGTYKNGLFYSTDNGESWSLISSEFSEKSATSLGINGENIFVGLYFGRGIILSTDNGENWRSVNNGLSSVYDLTVSVFLFLENKMIISTAGGLYYSTDNGGKWNKIEIGGNYKFSDLVKNQNKIFCGTVNKGIFFSTDKGETWFRIKNNGLPPDSVKLTIRDLAVYDGNIYAGTEKRGLFYSTDNGETWSNINNEKLKEIIAIYPLDSAIFVSSKTGVMLTTDNGKSWENTSMEIDVTNFNEFEAIGDYIFGSSSRGLFKAKLSDFGITVSVKSQTEAVNHLYTCPAFPMPAKNEVRSLVFWDKSRNIEDDKIAVYNVYGRKIAGKKDIRIDKLASYKGYLVWDCSGVENGVYLINIKHGTASRTIKVLVNK